MREIKFRAWDLDTKKMTDGFNRPQLVIRLSGKVTEGSTTPHIVLMQYTGCKDLNGKDVYAGDILQEQKNSPMTVAVEWNYLNLDYLLLSGRPTHFSRSEPVLPSLGDMVIIGNIYENPELLK